MKNSETREVSITRIEYPEGTESIRVIFDPDGGVSIEPPLTPRGGTEVQGEPPTPLNALEIVRLMNFAYGCGRASLRTRGI